MTKLNSHLNISETSYAKLKEKPFIWGEEIRNKKQFFTKNQKANLHFVENKLLSEKTNLEYPFILLTGRTRDQWHTGTKTNLPRTLLKYKELNFCEINTINAKKLSLKDGDEIIISSKRGKIESIVKITENIRIDTIFIPLSNREINYLTNDLYDKESLQPDYNHSAVKIEKITK